MLLADRRAMSVYHLFLERNLPALTSPRCIENISGNYREMCQNVMIIDK